MSLSLSLCLPLYLSLSLSLSRSLSIYLSISLSLSLSLSLARARFRSHFLCLRKLCLFGYFIWFFLPFVIFLGRALATSLALLSKLKKPVKKKALEFEENPVNSRTESEFRSALVIDELELAGDCVETLAGSTPRSFCPFSCPDGFVGTLHGG